MADAGEPDVAREREYTCDICKCGFKTPGALLAHLEEKKRRLEVQLAAVAAGSAVKPAA